MSPTSRTRPWWAVAASVAAVGLVLSGCSTGPNALGSGGRDQHQQQAAGQSGGAGSSTTGPDLVVTAQPADGARNVKVDTLVGLATDNGTLSQVKVSAPVKDRSGKTTTVSVNGQLSGDKTRWKASERLEPGVRYTVTSTGANRQGTKTTTTSTFTTQKLSLDEQTFAAITPTPGRYGVGMPIVIHFDVPVTDKKTFERHLRVTTTPEQAGTWSWYSSTEVHYRPRAYWKPGTKIKVDADINGLAAGRGIYGQTSRSAAYTIGKSIVTKVDVAAHEAQVVIDGKVARTLPISAGKPGFITRSGTKIISEKLPVTQMRSETIGINPNDPQGYDLKVRWAMRITNSGEFLHAAPWNAANMGKRNSSHGCIGMSTADAAWLFRIQQIGDPVVVTGTKRGLEKGNGWTDWNVSYAQFAKGSAG